MKKKKIGVYGGTFDPIHLGHIHLAQNLMEAHGLDEVWFCPAYQSPFKAESAATPPEKRYRMTELGVEAIPNFKVIDTEIKHPGPSYTVDTLRTLTKKYPDHQFYLLLGNDTARHFMDWKDPRGIIEMAKLIIGTDRKSVV